MTDIDSLANEYGRGIARAIQERKILPQRIAGAEAGTLYRFAADATEVIVTNGDPVWEGEDGFAELRALVTARRS